MRPMTKPTLGDSGEDWMRQGGQGLGRTLHVLPKCCHILCLPCVMTGQLGLPVAQGHPAGKCTTGFGFSSLGFFPWISCHPLGCTPDPGGTEPETAPCQAQLPLLYHSVLQGTVSRVWTSSSADTILKSWDRQQAWNSGESTGKEAAFELMPPVYLSISPVCLPILS